MNVADCAQLLALIQTFDNRRVTETMARAWSLAIAAGMTLDDAAPIVADHFATSSEYLMPVHINSAYRQLRDKRIERVGTDYPIPGGLTPAESGQWKRAFTAAVAAGDGRPRAAEVADDSVGVTRDDEVGPPTRPLAALLAEYGLDADPPKTD